MNNREGSLENLLERNSQNQHPDRVVILFLLAEASILYF